MHLIICSVQSNIFVINQTVILHLGKFSFNDLMSFCFSSDYHNHIRNISPWPLFSVCSWNNVTRSILRLSYHSDRQNENGINHLYEWAGQHIHISRPDAAVMLISSPSVLDRKDRHTGKSDYILECWIWYNILSQTCKNVSSMIPEYIFLTDIQALLCLLYGHLRQDNMLVVRLLVLTPYKWPSELTWMVWSLLPCHLNGLSL